MLVSAAMLLFSGVAEDALAGNKKPLKFPFFQKKTVKQTKPNSTRHAKPNSTADSPNPVVDDTPIIPRNLKDTSRSYKPSSRKTWIKPHKNQKKKKK